MRNYKLALNYYQQCLLLEPAHYEALCRVAEYYYRSGEYEEGVRYARKVLEHSTYDGGANFIYGNLLLKQGKLTEAEEALSVAARTMEYRSAAYVYIAGILLQKNDFEQAAYYCKQSLQYNNLNLLAYEFLATAFRKLNDVKQADSVAHVLLQIDPSKPLCSF